MYEFDTEGLMYSYAFTAGMLILYLVIFVGAFILQGYPLYKMAKRKGLEKPWLAFLPIGYQYIMIHLSDKPAKMFGKDLEDRNALFKRYLICLLIIYAIICCTSWIPCVGIITSLAACALSYAIMYTIYKDFCDIYTAEDTSTILAIVSLFVPFVLLVMEYVWMNKEPNKTIDVEVVNNDDPESLI